MENADVLNRLKYWLTLPGNTFPKLAVALDYDSDASIRMWVSRNRVPPREVQDLLVIIDRDIQKSLGAN